MFKRLGVWVIILALGLALTFASAKVNHKAPFVDACADFHLNQVKKGFPLPYILVKPSESLCNPVEPISIFWDGNAYHEEYPLNLLFDIVFWYSVASALVYAIDRLKSERS